MTKKPKNQKNKKPKNQKTNNTKNQKNKKPKNQRFLLDENQKPKTKKPKNQSLGDVLINALHQLALRISTKPWHEEAEGYTAQQIHVEYRNTGTSTRVLQPAPPDTVVAGTRYSANNGLQKLTTDKLEKIAASVTEQRFLHVVDRQNQGYDPFSDSGVNELTCTIDVFFFVVYNTASSRRYHHNNSYSIIESLRSGPVRRQKENSH